MIFDEAGSSLSPNHSAIIVGSIQLVGVYISTLLVDRAGRKFLLSSSAFCCALGLFAFGAYDLLERRGFYLATFNWVPLASFSFVMFVANLGEY
jgi:Sugar (and other) transporter